jgi:hypothetical protein
VPSDGFELEAPPFSPDQIASGTLVLLCTILLVASLVATPTLGLPNALTASDHFSLSIRTNPPYNTYSGTDTIVIEGTVSPPPSVASNVTISIKNPNGALVATALAAVVPGPFGGSYSHAFSAGASCLWASGTYHVMGLWSNPIGAAVAGANTTFDYVSTATCASTTTTTPEFGATATFFVALVAMAAAAVFMGRLLPSTKGNSAEFEAHK